MHSRFLFHWYKCFCVLLRFLNHVLIIYLGSSKSGTTSLAYYLQTHPLIVNINQFDPDTKENHWFDSRNVEGLSRNDTMNYIKNYDGRQYIRALIMKQPGFQAYGIQKEGLNRSDILSAEQNYIFNNRALVMDYTPNYLVNDETPVLIRKTFPSIYHKLKFIIMIRNPVARTISSWKSKKGKHGNKVLSFANVTRIGIEQGKCIEYCYNNYFQKDNVTLKEYIISMHTHSNSNSNRTHNEDWMEVTSRCSMKYCRRRFDRTDGGSGGGIASMAHIVKSMYIYQLINWLHVFSLEQFCIITLEEFISEPLVTIKKITDFLGIPMYDNVTTIENTIENITSSVNELTYTQQADAFAKKGSDKHKYAKYNQQQRGQRGWKNNEELLIILKKIKNRTKPNPTVDQEVTKELVDLLKQYFQLSNKRLMNLLKLNVTYD